MNYRNDLRVNHDTITRLKAPQNKPTMHKEIITLHELAANLDKALKADLGMRGLHILLYGWIKKEHKITQQTLSNRKRKYKTFFLTKTEAKTFSQYLGYDLMKN